MKNGVAVFLKFVIHNAMVEFARAILCNVRGYNLCLEYHVKMRMEGEWQTFKSKRDFACKKVHSYTRVGFNEQRNEKR